MNSNKTVLLGTLVIMAAGFAHVAVTGSGVTPSSATRVVAGGLGIALLASLLEMFGPRASSVASGLVGVATITVLLVDLPDIYKAVANAQKGAITGGAVAGPVAKAVGSTPPVVGPVVGGNPIRTS